jgi:hypothetical protein
MGSVRRPPRNKASDWANLCHGSRGMAGLTRFAAGRIGFRRCRPACPLSAAGWHVACFDGRVMFEWRLLQRGIFVATILTGCGGKPGDDAGSDDGGATRDPRTPYLTVLENAEDLELLQGESAGDGVKYLARVDGADPFEPLVEACYFQNMRVFPWHLQFLQSFPGHAALSLDGYRDLVIRKATRRFWGGTLRRWIEARDPARAERDVITYQVYTEAGALTVEDLVELDARLKGCMPYAQSQLMFLPDRPDQEAFLTRERENLVQRGVASAFAHELVGTGPNGEAS